MGIFRIFLALSVVNTHSGSLSRLPFLFGDQAVKIFFLVSGFYMALILSENAKYKNYKIFLANRFARIFSTYWIIIVFVLILRFREIFWIFKNIELGAAPLGLVLFANTFIFGSDAIMFFKQNHLGGGLAFTPNFTLDEHPLHNFLIAPPAWSLPLELCFYLIIPFLYNRRKTLLIFFCASILIKLLTLSYFGSIDPWTYRFFPAELWVFILGTYSYKFHQKFVMKLNQTRTLALLIFLLTGLACLLAYQNYSFQSHFNLGIQTLGNLILLTTFALLPFLFKISKSIKIDRLIGEFSYPIYILHVGVISYIANNKIKGGFFLVSSLTILIAGILLPITIRCEKSMRKHLETRMLKVENSKV